MVADVTRLFCDGSFDPIGRFGFAAFLRLDAPGPVELTLARVQFAFFEKTTNTRLEIQAVLHGLRSLEDGTAVEVYTDCAGVLRLLQRRARLEACEYRNRSAHTVANADLYRDFFLQCDRLVADFRWVQGHKPVGTRSEHEHVFAFLDRAVRRRLRYHRAKDI